MGDLQRQPVHLSVEHHWIMTSWHLAVTCGHQRNELRNALQLAIHMASNFMKRKHDIAPLCDDGRP